MPGPSVTGIACPRSNGLRLLVTLSGIALTPPQFSRSEHMSLARPVRQVFIAQGQMTELDHRVPFERNQNPAKPSGLL
jgi:hypothetical protein